MKGNRVENPKDFSAILAGRPIIAILRGMDLTTSLDIAQRVWDRGIGVVEVPVQDQASFEIFRALNQHGWERNEPVGAGTITDLELLARVLDADAAFTVAPGLDLDVLEASMQAGIPHLPGVGTASEVQAALRRGCRVVKAFPASSLSPSWFREMRGPFPQVDCVATGGIDASNTRAFLLAGAVAVGVGSALRSPSAADAFFDIVEEAVANRL